MVKDLVLSLGGRALKVVPDSPSEPGDFEKKQGLANCNLLSIYVFDRACSAEF